MQLLKLGAVVALAQSALAVKITLKTTNPPALPSEHHCTLIIHGDINGCGGSSKPWEHLCGRNKGDASTKKINGCSNGGEVTVDWYTGEVKYSDNDGGKAMCILNDVVPGSHCDTDHPHQFEKGNYNAATSISPRNVLYTIGGVIAAGMYL